MKLNSQIYDEASAWFVQCRAGDLDEPGRRELDRWLRKSPEHVAAYLEVAAIWGEGLSVDPTHKWDLDTLIAQASADPDNIVTLRGTAGAAPPAPSGPSDHLLLKLSKRRLWTLAASLAGLTVTAGIWTWLELTSPTYTTATGEQRSVELADGSTVSINSKSKVRIRYSKTERLVELLQGQALFHVAKDPGRPFTVSASGTRVRAVGTQFDVYEKRTGTRVTVIEGRVAILPKLNDGHAPSNTSSPWSTASPAGSASISASRVPGSETTRSGRPRPGSGGVPHAEIPLSAVTPIVLSAGEQVTVTPHVAQWTEHANVAAATAWQERQIVFDSATLGEVAEEFNRYNERQIVIDQPDLLTFHVSGVFSSTDPEDLIQFLRGRPGVRVREEGSKIHIEKKS